MGAYRSGKSLAQFSDNLLSENEKLIEQNKLLTRQNYEFDEMFTNLKGFVLRSFFVLTGFMLLFSALNTYLTNIQEDEFEIAEEERTTLEYEIEIIKHEQTRIEHELRSLEDLIEQNRRSNR